MTEDGPFTHDINHRNRAAWASPKKFSREHFRQSAPWRLNVRLLNAEAMEVLLHGYHAATTCTCCCGQHTAPAPTAGHRMPPRMRHLPSAIIVCQSARRESRGMRGNDHPTNKATSICGSSDLARWAPPEAAISVRGRPSENWQKSLEDDFKAFFGAADGSTEDSRSTLGIGTALQTKKGSEGEEELECHGSRR